LVRKFYPLTFFPFFKICKFKPVARGGSLTPSNSLQPKRNRRPDDFPKPLRETVSPETHVPPFGAVGAFHQRLNAEVL
jgi:hypothetical protein